MVRRRKNRHHLCTTLLWAVTAAAALVVAVGLCYVARGYAVPAAWIAAVVAAVSLAAASLWALRRHSVESASRFADRFFNLQDTVTSYLHFAAHGFRDGYYALQVAAGGRSRRRARCGRGPLSAAEAAALRRSPARGRRHSHQPLLAQRRSARPAGDGATDRKEHGGDECRSRQDKRRS